MSKINKNNIFNFFKNYVPYIILFYVFLLFITYIILSNSVYMSLDKYKNSSLVIGRVWEGLFCVFFYLLYCINKNKEFYNNKLPKLPMVLITLFIMIIFTSIFSGHIISNLNNVVLINFTLIFIITSFLSKGDKKENKIKTKFLSINSAIWFLISTGLICCMIFVLQQLYDSSSASITQKSLYVYPIYMLVFMFASWTNSRHFTFEFIVYPVISFLFFLLTIIHIVTISQESNGAFSVYLIYALLIEIIVAIFSFIIFLIKDIKRFWNG